MFSTTATLRNSTPLPEGVAPENGVRLLQSHDFFIQCDPHLVKYQLVDTPADTEPVLPPGRGATAVAPAKCYRVTDKVHAFPAGLWDSDVVSTYEFINIEKGVFVRVRSPMNTTLETVWEVQETNEGRLVLVEDLVIQCSRFWVSFVKSTGESGWPDFHGKMIRELQRGSCHGG